MKKLAVVFACGILASQTLMASIIYNTGVDNNGNLLAPGAVDSHWTIIAAPNPPVGVVPAQTFAVVNPPASYIKDNSPANSQWISFDKSAYSGNSIGYYQYQTTFILPVNADLSSVRLSGKWSSDNDGYRGISLNNAAFTQQRNGTTVFQSFGDFAYLSGFVAGQNTLTFEIWDGYAPAGGSNGGGSYTGLIVDDLQLTYSAVPEPTTFIAAALLLLPFGASAIRSMRRNRKA